MNGAKDELCATTISAPKRNMVKIIGSSHHRFCFPKKPSSSPPVCKFLVVVRTHFMVFSSECIENEWLRLAACLPRQSGLIRLLTQLPTLSARRELSSAEF